MLRSNLATPPNAPPRLRTSHARPSSTYWSTDAERSVPDSPTTGKYLVTTSLPDLTIVFRYVSLPPSAMEVYRFCASPVICIVMNVRGIRMHTIDISIVTSDASPGDDLMYLRTPLYSGCSTTANTRASTKTIMNGRNMKNVNTEETAIRDIRK